jgi:hypothetical protein
LPPALDRCFRLAMAKDPEQRFESGTAFVEALRRALAEPEHTTRVAPPPPPHVPARGPVRRTRHPWRIPAILGLLAALAIVGALLAAALMGGEEDASGTQSVVTQVTTQEGERVTVTETVEPPPPPTTASPPPPPAAGGASGQELTDQSTGLMRQGRYEEALPIAQQALAKLQGSGELYEAYANYNVGRSLIELGRCEEGLPHIDASEAIQGSRAEFREARAKCDND